MANRVGNGRLAPFSGLTAWSRSVQTPVRHFVRTETGGAAVQTAGARAALATTTAE